MPWRVSGHIKLIIKQMGLSDSFTEPPVDKTRRYLIRISVECLLSANFVMISANFPSFVNFAKWRYFRENCLKLRFFNFFFFFLSIKNVFSIFKQLKFIKWKSIVSKFRFETKCDVFGECRPRAHGQNI